MKNHIRTPKAKLMPKHFNPSKSGEHSHKSAEEALDAAHRILAEWFDAGVILATDESEGITNSYRRQWGNAFAVDALVEQVGMQDDTFDDEDDLLGIDDDDDEDKATN